MSDKETIPIEVEEYDYLIKRDQWLTCLEMAGVDNWQGLEYAIDLKDELYPENDEE